MVDQPSRVAPAFDAGGVHWDAVGSCTHDPESALVLATAQVAFEVKVTLYTGGGEADAPDDPDPDPPPDVIVSVPLNSVASQAVTSPVLCTRKFSVNPDPTLHAMGIKQLTVPPPEIKKVTGPRISRGGPTA